MAIIESLLDTDLYKLTMMQAIYHKYTNVHVKYKFKWRNWKKMVINEPLEDIVNHINDEIDNLCELRFKEDELNYLKSIPFMKDDFIEFLRLFKLNRDHILAFVNDENKIEVIIEGPWLNTILFEVPVLAIISELYTELYYKSFSTHFNQGLNNLGNEIDYLNKRAPSNFKYGDFGTRRRASKDFQRRSIEEQLTKSNHLVGTSNVYFARKYNIIPLGTHAHEWFQSHQQLNSRLINSQKDALQSWADEYRGDLGIALSDCITFDAFLADFDKYFAKLFDGCRHDSGDPYEWTDKLILHYNKLKINPKIKTALYSDGLDFSKAIALYEFFNNYINTSFGIGTFLTNNCGFEPPQIVIKMVECGGLPVAKVSDSLGKGMCEDPEFEDYLRKVINQKTEGMEK